MKYSEKREIENFVNNIADTICKESNRQSEVMRLCHNAKVEITEFLDDNLSYQNIKTFKPIQKEHP